MDAAEKRVMTADEYLAMERASDEKHEFFEGEIFAMAGASREHNLIVGNLVGELRDALRRRPCEVYPSDMRVKIAATGLYTYPDVTVVCGKPQLEDAHGDTLLNPQVVFEVLSDTTESYDRRHKFKHYRTMPSLMELVLVAQREVFVEHYARQPDGSWLLREWRAGQRLALPALDCAIDVDEIYARVFDQIDQPPA